MKKIAILCLYLTRAFFCTAQPQTEFASPPALADLQMKTYPQDPTAPACILYESGDVLFDQDNAGEVVMEIHIKRRVKVFSDKGLSTADVKIIFRSDEKYERVKDLAGLVYSLNEKGETETLKLQPDNIIRQAETDATTAISFSLPGVKTGSVFDYSYTLLKKSFTAIDPWYLQHEIPTRKSRFMLEIIPGLGFTSQFTILPGAKLQRQEEEAGSKVFGFGSGSLRVPVKHFTFAMENVEAFRPEPYMPGIKSQVQRLAFLYVGTRDKPLYKSWKEVAIELDDDFYFGAQLRKKINIPELEEGLAGIASYTEKLRYIHQFVRKSFAWNGGEDYLSLNVKKINRDRKGTTGDINLVLLNLLQHHGIEAYPLLCSTKDNGPVNILQPNPAQFNTLNVLARVGDKYWVLNGADKYNPPQLVPYDVIDTKALMLKGEEEPQWIEIWEPGLMEKLSVACMVQLGESGELSGNAYLASGGYGRAPRLKALDGGKEAYVKTLADESMPIENFTLKNESADTLDLVQQFNFSGKMKTAGEYYYFNTNLFTGLEKNPFVADKRITDILFHYNRRYVFHYRIVLPENMEAETLPQNTRLIMPDTGISFERTYFREDNVITLRQTLEINKPVFTASEYGEFREFYKKLFDMLNEQVVLRKKK